MLITLLNGLLIDYLAACKWTIVWSIAKKNEGCANLMAVMRLLMESDTVREWPARMDQVGGSFGLMTRERAVSSNWVELSSIDRAERRIGS